MKGSELERYLERCRDIERYVIVCKFTRSNSNRAPFWVRDMFSIVSPIATEFIEIDKSRYLKVSLISRVGYTRVTSI